MGQCDNRRWKRGAKFALFLEKEAFLGQCYGGRYCGGRNLHCFLKRRLFWDSMIAADRGRTVAKKALRQAQFFRLAKRGKGEDKNTVKTEIKFWYFRRRNS